MISLEDIENNREKRIILAMCMMANFSVYFKQMFYLINGVKPFFLPFHKKICDKLQSLVEGKNDKRNLAICLPVGSGKSIICEYFITWCFARSPNNDFCYVSHSDELIRKMSMETRNIIQEPVFGLLFSRYLKRDDKSRTNYSFENANNRTGLTAGSLGSGLTGLDAGNPVIQGFSGALIADDLLDAGKRNSQAENENVIRLLNEKLNTRRRTPTTPTILIMQRLSRNDIVGWIKENEPDFWDILEIPALDENNMTSFWEDRYPVDELLHIKNVTPAKFYAQYQQNPIVDGGSVLKREWWRYYKDTNVQYSKIYITADTAQKTIEWNDFTAIGVWGLTTQRQLYLLDLVHGKFEAPELESAFMGLYCKWKNGINGRYLSAVYIEDKVSGTGLIQGLKRKGGIPVIAIQPDKDKLSRVYDCVGYIASGNVYLPESENNQISREVLSETDSFSADMSHLHDDIVDMITYGIKQAYEQKGLF